MDEKTKENIIVIRSAVMMILFIAKTILKIQLFGISQDDYSIYEELYDTIEGDCAKIGAFVQ